MHSVRNRYVAALLAGAILPLSSAMLSAQQPGAPPGSPGIVKPPATWSKAQKPSKLEEMLAEALRNNPDIRVASADVARAEAELQRVRLQVIEKILKLHDAIDKAQAEVADGEKRLAELHSRNLGVKIEPSADLDAARLRLKHLQAEASTLVGKAPREAAFHQRMEWSHGPELKWKFESMPVNTIYYRVAPYDERRVTPSRPTSRMEKLRKALETPVKVNYKEHKLSQVLKDLEKQAPGLGFRDARSLGDHLVNLTFEEPMPVAVLLQAIEDEMPYAGNDPAKPRFVVREYGILLTTQQAMPPGAFSPEDFVRRATQEEPRRSK